jgi:hypothetical protein
MDAGAGCEGAASFGSSEAWKGRVSVEGRKEMILQNISPELAATWARELLISGWPMNATMAAIRELDRAKPLQRRMMLVRWELPYPKVADDVLVDENGDRLVSASGKVRNHVSLNPDRLIVSVEKRSARRAKKAATATMNREMRAAEAWIAYEMGDRKHMPGSARPHALIAQMDAKMAA